MARKPRTTKASRSRTSNDAAATGDTILDAALAEAADAGWRAMSLAAVADRAGVSLGDLLAETPSKAHLLARFISHIDRATLRGVTAPDLSQSPRDRVFDVMMRRFDALNKNRAAVLAVLRGLCRDPAQGLLAWARTDRSGAAMLAAAGISPDGLRGLLRIQGLKAIYLATLRTWMRDDTADMANTMAALDGALRRAEQLLKFIPRPPRRTAATAEDASL